MFLSKRSILQLSRLFDSTCVNAKIASRFMGKKTYFAPRFTMGKFLSNIFMVGLSGQLDYSDSVSSISSCLCNAGITLFLSIGNGVLVFSLSRMC